ncbi:ATP-binding protein [Azohydromonas caseinilytica]|uniref:histidine kinase n=1 Tax=Azohydromonas caseinilytica TaxID=2728836 RepID=A0A848FA61_9BURK|nr:ATP-binding protein [Azohydromonas caseinilytica]NML15746.1 PAS domain S-box protein [Azohydromonas caseinilytica]
MLSPNPESHAAERQRFLLMLTDVLRGHGDTRSILEQVSAQLGSHFGVNRVGYGHVDEQLDLIDYDVCWTDGSVPPLMGCFPASAFGQQVIDRLRAGQTIVIANVREHPLTSDLAALRTSHEVDTRAILVVPLFKAGRLRTIVYLNQRAARPWTAHEVELMNEVAERTRELIERGRTEQALRESEAKWRGLFERMGEGFFIGEALRDAAGHMVDFNFVEVNPAFERLTGIPARTALGRPVREVIPGVPDELVATYARVVDSGEPLEFEVHIPALNDRWYEARARAIGPGQFSVLFLEITQRKAAEQAFVLSEQRYRTLFESIDEGFCIVQMLFDAEGRPHDYRFLELNPAFERHTGMAGARGRTIRELVPGIEPTWVETYGRVARTGESLRFEEHAASMGRWFDAFAFRVGQPQEHKVALLFTDITQRKRAEQALREREAELREAQSLARLGGWTWDARTDLTEPSPELLRIFGLDSPDQIPPFSRQAGVLYPPQDWERLNAAVQQTLAHGSSHSIDVRAFRGGEPIWVIARGTAIRNADGTVIGMRGTVQDITERKLAEEALREADVRKDEFLATLAHELRNPLAPIANGLAILRHADAGSPVGVRARELMERQLAQLVRLVDDLLDVSRVSQGKVELKKAVVSLNAVLELALETSRPLIEAAGHQLAVQLPQDTVLLWADATRLAQVLSNLLNNAAKYTRQGGHITLSAQCRPGQRLAIAVSDDGIGIPRDMLGKVFDLFTQVGSALDRSQGGLGIGLSLAKRLVELHEGHISAHSAGPDQGSTFTVELPLCGAPVAARTEDEARRAQPRAARQRRVLVVDDNVDAAETLALLLQMEGHAVQVEHDGRQALAAARAQRPDLVFLDIGMPGLNGYEVADRLRGMAELSGTVLVAVTGWGSERDQQRAREAGFDGHLTKPVTEEGLAGALRLRRQPGA